MPHRALEQILQGGDPPVEVGELIPASYHDLDGTEHPIDFDRLVELGVAEPVKPPAKSAAKSTAK